MRAMELMDDENVRETFMDTARREVLTLLEREGSMTLADIPRRWPLTRTHLKYVVLELIELGMIEEGEPGSVPGKARLGLTDRGRERLEEMRRRLHAA